MDRHFRNNNYTTERQDYSINRRGRSYVSRKYGNNSTHEFIYKRYSQTKYYIPKDELRYTRQRKIRKKKPSRPASPDEGSEEFMTKKIQKTSAIIMRQLLSPEESQILPKPTENHCNASVPHISHNVEQKSAANVEPNYKTKIKTRKKGGSSCSESHPNKKVANYNAEEIHNKIMNHLSNLNDGRKKNLISTRTSIYDEAIQQIVKQKRLEISRALRNVCLQSSDVTESTEWINSIIPDMGIKIEELPQEILEELQVTFSNPDNFENSLQTDFSGLLESNDSVYQEVSYIKQEVSETLDAPDGSENHSNSFIDVPQSEYFMRNGSEIVNNPEKQTENSFIDVPPSDISVRSSSEIVNTSENIEISSDNTEVNVENTDGDNGIEISPSPLNSVIDDTAQESKDIISLITTKDNEIDCLVPSASNSDDITIQEFIKRNFKVPPKDLSSTVHRMHVIDKYISELTEYRQKLFNDLMMNYTEKVNTQNDDVDTLQENNQCEDEQNQSKIEKSGSEQKILELQSISEKILVLKVCEDKLLAATEAGKIYFFNLEDGRSTNVVNATSLPISSLAFTNQHGKPYLFVGSCESSLKVYNLYSTCLLQSIPLDDSIQCMDENWGYLFLGCSKGTIMRYSIKRGVMEYQDQFNFDPIFVMKATQEGARRVLLIGSRNAPIIIRDAMSGLHLRRLELMYPTVYSMIIHKHFVICGTTLHDILIFNFHNGNLEHTFEATNAKGVGCMKVVGKCLFASCYNGNIYVFNLEKNTLEGTIYGPGGVIISMEILSNQVVVGTMSFNFASFALPKSILSQMS